MKAPKFYQFLLQQIVNVFYFPLTLFPFYLNADTEEVAYESEQYESEQYDEAAPEE